jgi:hypothetical protein
MKRPTLLLFCATLLVGGCVFAWLIGGRSRKAQAIDAANSREDSGEDDTARLARELALLRAQVGSLGRQMVAPPRDESGGREAAARKDPRTETQTRAQAEERRREHIAGLEAQFRGEASDPQWAPVATQALAAALGSSEVGLVARQVECRSQTCRVEIPDDGSEKLNKAMPVLALQVARTLPSVVADRLESANGGATLVLYLRSGAAMPPTP